MTESVGIEAEVEIPVRQAEQRPEVLAGLEDLPRHRLAARHVLVGLDPLGCGHLPLSAPYPLPYLGQERRGEALDYLVYRGLRLGEGESGIIAHEPEHRPHRVDGQRGGLVVAPHPVHVDVSVSGEDLGVVLRDGAERGEHILGRLRVGARHGAAAVEGTADVLRGSSEEIPVDPRVVLRERGEVGQL